MERLFQVLSATHPLSEGFKRAIEKVIIPISFPKDHKLLEAPQIAEHAYFIDDGFAMSYSFPSGQKQIEGFWASGQIIVPVKSFFQRVPTKESIQLLVPSNVLHISYTNIMQLMNTFPEANIIYRVIMNQCYELSLERNRDLQHLRAQDRYKKLLHAFPGIEQIVSQEHIASYLGIAPQSLSRIKRQRPFY